MYEFSLLQPYLYIARLNYFSCLGSCFHDTSQFIVQTHTKLNNIEQKQRGYHLLYLGYYWTLGSLLVPVLAFFTLGENQDGSEAPGRWRLFVLLCAVPCIVSCAVAIRWVPESPHFLVSKGRTDKALAVLKAAAKENGRDPEELFPSSVVVRQSDVQEIHSVKALFNSEWRMLTLKIWGCWFGFAFLYYGTTILVTMTFAENDIITESAVKDASYDFDYSAIFLAASAEVVGQTFVLLTVETWGRVRTQALSYFLGGFSILGLAFFAAGDAKRGVLMFTAFLARMFMMGSSATTWVVTAEILPTQIRNTGMPFSFSCFIHSHRKHHLIQHCLCV